MTDELYAQARADRIAALRRLVGRMRRIQPAGDDCFRVAADKGAFDRIYGGLILADAMMAAATSVAAGRRMHSAHCHFLRLGDPAFDSRYVVERLRDTRTFSVRQVRAMQADRLLSVATFSFTAPTDGVSHQSTMPDAPPPERVTPRDVELIAMHGGALPVNAGVPWAFDLRHVDRRPWDRTIGDGRHRVWMRADEPIGDDPLLHAGLLLYASDFAMADAVTAQHPIVWEDLIAARGLFGASIDHTLWLHAPVRIDKWLLHVQESTRAADGRGFATGRFFDEAGVLVASVAQELFIKQAGEAQ